MRNLDVLKLIVNNAWKISSYSYFYGKEKKLSKNINSITDLKKFPILNKQKYFQLIDKKDFLNAKNIYLKEAILNADGDRIILPLSRRDYQNYILFEKRKWELIGVNKTDLCSIIAFSQDATVPMVESFLALGASYFPADGDEEKIFKDIVSYKVTVIFTIFPVLERLMDYVKKNGLKTSLRLVITTGVKIPDVNELNKKTQKILGADLIDTIGSTELASFAFSCKENRNFYHFVDQQQIVEILDPLTEKKSKEGEIIITPLWKFDYPLLRYATGDLTVLNSDLRCNCNVRDKRLIAPVTRKVSNEKRIERYLLNLEEFYYKVRDAILWQQNFFDKYFWLFFKEPKFLLFIRRVNHKDRIFIFVEKNKFILSLRKRKSIEDAISKISSADSEVVLCDKEDLVGIYPNYQDLRNKSNYQIDKKIQNLFNLC